MSIRVTLAPLFHIADDSRTLDAAFGIARRFGGHVDATLIQPNPLNTIPMVGEGVSADAIRQLMEAAVAVMEQQRDATKMAFDQASNAANMALVDRPDDAGDRPSAAWSEDSGRGEDILPGKALFSDLVIFPSAVSDIVSALRPTFETVLLKSRRPILLVPNKESGAIGQNVAIAWNATSEAASALSAAMPFLAEAENVHLLTAATARTDAEMLSDAANYLAWHGISCGSHAVEVRGEPVGAALMKKAVDIGADLLVMGGYGHHRLRERILGGVTDHVLHHAELRILIAH